MQQPVHRRRGFWHDRVGSMWRMLRALSPIANVTSAPSTSTASVGAPVPAGAGGAGIRTRLIHELVLVRDAHRSD